MKKEEHDKQKEEGRLSERYHLVSNLTTMGWQALNPGVMVTGKEPPWGNRAAFRKLSKGRCKRIKKRIGMTVCMKRLLTDKGIEDIDGDVINVMKRKVYVGGKSFKFTDAEIRKQRRDEILNYKEGKNG